MPTAPVPSHKVVFDSLFCRLFLCTFYVENMILFGGKNRVSGAGAARVTTVFPCDRQGRNE